MQPAQPGNGSEPRPEPHGRMYSVDVDSSAPLSFALHREPHHEGYRRLDSLREDSSSSSGTPRSSSGRGVDATERDAKHDMGGSKVHLLDTPSMIINDPLHSDMLASDETLEEAVNVADLIAKPSSWKRWVVLVLATLAIFGPYYSFDNPAGTA